MSQPPEYEAFAIRYAPRRGLPGHDPLVMERRPLAEEAMTGIVAGLD